MLLKNKRLTTRSPKKRWVIRITTASGMFYYRGPKYWVESLEEAYRFKTKRKATEQSQILIFNLCRAAERKREVMKI